MKINKLWVTMLILCLVVPIVFVGFTLNLSSVSAEPDTTIYIDPTPVTADVCENFTVALNVNDVTDLYAWQVKLSFDPDLLECLSVTEGPFLMSHGPTIFISEIDNDAGTIIAACALMMPPGVSGSGTLAYIEFHCDGSGECDLVFVYPDTFLLDSYVEPIPHSAVNGHVIQTEAFTRYLHKEEPLVPVHLHNEESLVPIHMNSNMTLTPVHMHYVGDPSIDPIYEPWFTPWHELYPEFCQEWILTSFVDYNGDGILSPNDQIDISDPTGLNVTWYHVDRITWTVLLSNPENPDQQMYIEYKGTFEPIEDPINYPVCTYWHEVYPNYCNVYHIIAASGPLEWCTYIILEQYIDGVPTGIFTEWHVEDVARDLILREKIMDPICTWWHEIYPKYCEWWHLTSWEDTGAPFGQLSPSDQIDMDTLAWITFWSMGDVDRDGYITVTDAERIAAKFGWTGPPGGIPEDINSDGRVDMQDVQTCAKNVGKDFWTTFPGASMKEWYHVDRVTLTLNVTLEMDPSRWMKIELKTKYFEDMYNALKHPIDTLWHEVYPEYSNVYWLWEWDWWNDDNCNGVLDVCDYIWLYDMSSGIVDRYHVEDICYDIILNKKIMDPRCTYWHEIYPNYCKEWHLTSWEEGIEDLYPGRLSPCDQIDMDCDAWYWETFWSMGDVNRDGYIDETDADLIAAHFCTGDPQYDINKDGHVDMYDLTICANNQGLDIWTYFPDLGKKKWYHVDRVTLTIYVTDNVTGEPYYFEYKGPFEDMYSVKTNPLYTYWHMVWPEYWIYPEEPFYIDGWIDNCNGVLDYCDYISIWGYWFHIEEVAIDLILNEKITDPTCTIWHEICPEYCNEYHIVGWEDNDDGLLSPCDQIKMTLLPEGPTKEYHVDYVTFTINITNPYDPGWWMLLEYYYEGPVETMYWVKTHPIGSWWYEPCSPVESRQIQDWMDNCNGVLDHCDYVMFYDYWYHIEDVAVDIIVTEKIHDVAVTAVSSRYPVVYQGQIDPIDVTVTNLGNYNEPTVDVYAYYDGNLAAPKQTTSLNIGETKTLTFNWDTTTVLPGVYTISAQAVIPIDDVPGNNQLTDGTQEVKRPPPKILDVELYPMEVVDLEVPIGTQWHELHPSKTNYYHLSDWLPGMVLGPEDWVMMDGWVFLVDDLTIDIEVVDVETEVRYWLDYECGYWTFNPRNPVSTKWNEIKNSETHTPPEWPRCWHLIDWEDNGDGRLSFCDYIIMAPNDPFPGAPHMFHVELVTVTLKLTDESMQQHYLEFMGTLEDFEAMDFIHFPFWTMWFEIWPEQGRPWMLHDWADQPFLAPSDRIVLTLKDPNTHEPIPGTEAEYHVDKVTVAMNLTSMYTEMTHIVKFEGSLVQFKYHQWGEPFGTQWHEVNPTYCRQWCIIDWYDSQPNGILDYCDMIWMVDKETGEVVQFHVESLSTDMWLTISHDVAVTNVTKLKTVVCQGYPMRINVTVENQGYYTETVDVTVYANTTAITTQTITLTSGNSTTITFTWNTTGFAKGNYTIWAYAWPVPGETDTADNTLIGATVLVTIPGDVNGDKKVRVDDVLAVALRFGTDYGGPPNSQGYVYDANCDINSDGKIRVDDVLIAALNFGQGPW